VIELAVLSGISDFEPGFQMDDHLFIRTLSSSASAEHPPDGAAMPGVNQRRTEEFIIVWYQKKTGEHRWFVINVVFAVICMTRRAERRPRRSNRGLILRNYRGTGHAPSAWREKGNSGNARDPGDVTFLEIRNALINFFQGRYRLSYTSGIVG
jgi:hypothetical protein